MQTAVKFYHHPSRSTSQDFQARRLSVERNNYGDVAGWLSVTAGIVSKRLNLSENFLDHLVGPSFKHLGPLTPIPNSAANPFSGGVKYTVGGKIGDFYTIFDGYRRLSRKQCEIGRWLLWNVNRKSWESDLVV